jgi:hypothetical protein
MNPSNKHIEEISSFDSLWILLIAPLYFILKGIWRHLLLWLILSPTLVSIVIYPLFAKSIIHNNYLRMGWTQVGSRYSDGGDDKNHINLGSYRARALRQPLINDITPIFLGLVGVVLGIIVIVHVLNQVGVINL